MPSRKPTFCYVATTRDDPRMLIMAHVAVLTLKHVHPKSNVVLLIDTPTQRVLDENHPSIRDVVSRVVTVDTQIEDGAASSRYLKTRMRELIDGNLLFLDIDTLVLRKLNPLWEHDAVLCGVHDDNNLEGPFEPRLVKGFAEMGWPEPRQPYLNSGVLFWRDCDQAGALGIAWHKYWLEGRSVIGDVDQPALHRAMVETGVPIKLLGQDYNQKVRDKPGILKKPAVLHYETYSAMNSPHTLINHLMVQLTERGEIDEGMLDRARKRNDPWGSAGPGIKGNWHTGRYGHAALEGVKRVLGMSGGKP